MKTTILAIASTMACCSASAQGADEQPLTKANLGPIYASLIDAASGGCWTNLVETKNYAHGQLDIAGFEVAEDRSDARTLLNIYVQAERADSARCYGGVSISVRGWAIYDYGDTPVALMVGPMTTFTGAQNSNNIVLDSVQKFVKRLLAELPAENQ